MGFKSYHTSSALESGSGSKPRKHTCMQERMEGEEGVREGGTGTGGTGRFYTISNVTIFMMKWVWQRARRSGGAAEIC